jgi:hypothetical protein
MQLSTQDFRGDNSRSVRGADRDSKMATEGHRKKSKEEKLAKWDEEETRNLYELKADIDKLEIKMWQGKKSRWVHDWPMQKLKASWPVK